MGKSSGTWKPGRLDEVGNIGEKPLLELWRMEPARIQFLLRSVCDIKHKSTQIGSYRKSKLPFLEHVLSSCKVAL